MTKEQVAEAHAAYEAAMIAEIQETGSLTYAPPFHVWCREHFGSVDGSSD